MNNNCKEYYSGIGNGYKYKFLSKTDLISEAEPTLGIARQPF